MALFKVLLWIAEKIQEQAEAELHDESRIRQEMTELYRRLEAGEITEEEFETREAELVARLVAIDEAKQRAEGEEDERGGLE